MKIVAVVPMKLNNSRLPNKNTKSFTNGNPLCSYILTALLKTEGIDDVYVYCSNPDIKEYIPDGVHFLRRSEKYDTNAAKMNEILKGFAEEVYADFYLLTHTTAPFITPSSIAKGISAVKDGRYDSAFAVKKLQDFMWCDNKPLNYDLDNIPRTQDLPPYYMETSGFYIYKREMIMEHNRRIGNNPYMVEVSEIESIDIDEPDDFLIADAIFNHIIKSR